MKKQTTKEANQRISETIINGSRVFIEDGEVKTILSEEIQRTGFMTVEDLDALLDVTIYKIYELNGNL